MQSSKIVLITGTSSGFGLLTAIHLAKKGHKVIATMRNLQKKSALLNEAKKEGCEVEILPLDVTDKDSIAQAIAEVAKKHGYIDVLVNNAGYGIGGCFEDLTDEEIRDQMETNFYGVQNMIRACLPMMRARKSGKIINISSSAGFSGSPCFSAYNASKWALEGFTESLYYELLPFGIDIYLVQPGTYRTKIFDENARYAKNFHNEDSPYYAMSMHLDKMVQEHVKDCFKDPNEISRLVEKLINAKHAKFRSIPDIETKARYFIKKFFSFSLYSKLVSKALFGKFNLKKN